MDRNQRLAEQFEEQRPRMRSVAYRILGSSNEADDAVQEAWLRLSRSKPDEIGNLAGWLTTVVARVCLSMLRSRNVLREEPLEAEVAGREERHPEDEALLADSVGLALQVVLDTLSPDERLAFVLHDMFDLPFEEIAVIVRRTPVAARQLASRARRRVKDSAVPRDRDTARQRKVVNAFFAAARSGDFDALVAILDPDVVLRIDADIPGSMAFKVAHGAEAVANQALLGLAPALRAVELQPVLVQGVTGMIAARRGQPITVMSFAVADGKITKIDAVTDPERVQAAAAPSLTSPGTSGPGPGSTERQPFLRTERGLPRDCLYHSKIRRMVLDLGFQGLGWAAWVLCVSISPHDNSPAASAAGSS